MFKRRNSSRADRYRGGSGGGSGLFAQHKVKVPHRTGLVAQRRSRHVGKGRDETIWDLIKSLFPQKRRSGGHTGNRKEELRPRLFTRNSMKNYKARGHKVFAQKKNPFQMAMPHFGSHSGHRRNALQSKIPQVASRHHHQGKKRSKSKTTASPLAHRPYKPTGKKFKIKSTGTKSPKNNNYRSGSKGKKYKVKATQVASSHYRSGAAGKKHRAKIKAAVSANYRSGATGKKYKYKTKPIPTPSYRTGSMGKKYKVKAMVKAKAGYRSGVAAKRHKAKVMHHVTQNYRSGSSAKRHHKELALPIHNAYRSGGKGKKYRVKSKPLPSTAYTGGQKKAMKEVKVVAGSPYRSGSSSANRKKKILALQQSKPYRKGNRVQRYKVKSTSKVRPSPRKFNATAARTKNLAYLQKNTKGKKRKYSEKDEYQGHMSFNQFLRGIILILFILVGVSIYILAKTTERWLQ